MRNILTLVFIYATSLSYGCTCAFSDIQKSYIHSSLIFYGKHIGTDTIIGFNDIYGRPFIVENFEINNVYRGIDSATFNHIKSKNNAYVISLISSCFGACGICFEREKNYLVFAYRDF